MRQPVTHYALVIAQLSGVALAVVPSSQIEQAGVVWLVLAAAGIGLGVWTLGHNRIGNFSIFPVPKDDAALIESGPYRHVRHPMYSALSLMMIGIAGYNGGLRHVLGAVLVIVVVVTKALIEERYMHARFPNYAAYAARVRRFVPFVV